MIGGIVFTFLNTCMGAFIMAGAMIVPVKPGVNSAVQHGLFLSVGAFLILGSAYMLFQIARHFGLQVTLHQAGLAVSRGDKVSVFPWDEIETVWHKQAANLQFEDWLASTLEGSQSVYTLAATSGERVVLNSLLRDH
ncbi:MAG: hypothetical protein ACP5XB_22480, partial [Isosphaeraceae bacterium]